MENFEYRSILVDSGSIVQCKKYDPTTALHSIALPKLIMRYISKAFMPLYKQFKQCMQ